MLWLGLHFPLLPLEIFAPTAGTADGAPAVVIEHDRVMLANAAAHRAGIVTGSTLATAHSIVPGLIHHRRNPERERERLTLLAETLYGFSARVTLSPTSPGGPPPGIALEIGASLRLFGDAEALGERVAALCRELGHTVRGRRGRTPLAALILARAGADDLARVSLSAAAVEPEQLPAAHIERLANMGVRTLEQLLALPRSGLARRLGADLADYLDRIVGERPDPRPLVAPAERFRARVHLLEPLQNKEALAFPMQRLLNDLQHWLVARQLGAEQLRWHFAGSAAVAADASVAADAAGEDGHICMPVRFARARQRREAFLDVTRLRLDATALPEDVLDITLEAHGLVPWQTASHGLFQNLGGDTDTMDDASELVDQLRARLGADACYSLETVDQYAPERAWQRVPALGRRRGNGDSSRGATSQRTQAKVAPAAAGQMACDQAAYGQVECAATRRPLWLFEPPRAIAADQLTLLRGPERIHTGWWAAEGAGCARDYYVARHHDGAECWVFVDPWDRWFLHGYFA